MAKKWCCALTIILLMAALPLSALCEQSFSLPPKLVIIAPSAFENVPIEELVIPDQVDRIESRSFVGTGVKRVYIPESVSYIAPDAFDLSEELVFVTPPDSYAAQWCAEQQAAAYTLSGLSVPAHTQAQIREFAAAHPADTVRQITFRQLPQGGEYSSGAYYPGLMSEESIADGINMLNQIRYIAGLNADVTHNPVHELMESAASMVHAMNGMTSHYPARPEELSDASYDWLYELACEGASSSNLYAAKSNMGNAMLGYMLDPGESNLKIMGHRRWLLNPSMATTTFGYHYMSDSTWGHYTCMYVFDRSGAGNQNLVAWPGQQTPVSHFIQPAEHAWSLSFGRALDASAIEVTLTRRQDGRVWRFSSEESDGAFYVDNNWYGKPGCVIFLPEEIGGVSAGDCFDVTVTDHAKKIVVRYTVNFFDL